MGATQFLNLDTRRVQHDSNSLPPTRPPKNVGWDGIWLDASKPSIRNRINVYRGVWTSVDDPGHQFESHSLRQLRSADASLVGGSSGPRDLKRRALHVAIGAESTLSANFAPLTRRSLAARVGLATWSDVRCTSLSAPNPHSLRQLRSADASLVGGSSGPRGLERRALHVAIGAESPLLSAKRPRALICSAVRAIPRGQGARFHFQVARADFGAHGGR
jgi:hypothetical protein